MNLFFIAFCFAVVASARVNGYSAGNGFQQHQAEVAADSHAGEFQLQSGGHVVEGVGSGSASGSANAAGGTGNSGSSLISYPNNKGEILIHRPAAIIVKRPPTKVVVNHPPLVVKPAPVVLHKPPAVVVRKVFVKHHPRPVKVEPVYVNVVKPPAEKYFVNEKQQPGFGTQDRFSSVSGNAGFAPISGMSAMGGTGISAGGASGMSGGSMSGAGFAGSEVESAAVNAGYQLIHNNQALAALANLSSSGGSSSFGSGSSSSHSSYNGPSY